MEVKRTTNYAASQNKIVLPTGFLIKLVRPSDRYSCDSSN